MISEIIIGKKYVVPILGYHRTPIHIYKGYVMYEHDYGENLECALCDIGEFKNSVEETPEEWYEVVSFQKNDEHPYSSNYLYKSKEHFLKASGQKEDESGYHWIKLTKVEL